MKKRYFLPLLQRAFFLFISLFLQNCSGLHNLPIQEEEEPTETVEQGRRKRARIEMGEEESEEQRLIEEHEGNALPTIMPELWQEVFSYLNFEGVLAARSVNKDWNKLITGYREAGIVGIENNPHHIIDTWRWVKREKIDFRNNKLKELTPATIPSFAFYHLIGETKNLPQSFWSCLQGTQVYTLNLEYNEIGDAGVIELAKALPGTQVHTLNLWYNQIGASGVKELAKALPGTQVHTLNLWYNEIGAAGARELAKALPSTQVHTLNLESNEIGDQGARELAKALPSTQVHTLYLWGNEIGDAGALELAKALPSTQVHTLNLESNEIGDQGAIEFAKVLPETQVLTLDLNWNQIGATTRKLLVKQYPHIKWSF
jgi:hypothetical protein